MHEFWKKPRKLTLKCKCCGEVSVHTLTLYGDELIALCDDCKEPMALRSREKDLKVLEMYVRGRHAAY